MKKVLTTIVVLGTFLCSAQKDLFVDFPNSDLEFKMSAYQKAGGAFGSGVFSKKIRVLNDEQIILSNFNKAGLNPFVQKGSLEWIQSDGDFNQGAVVKMKIGSGKSELSDHEYFDCFYTGETPILLTRQKIDKETVKLIVNVLDKNTYQVVRSQEVFTADINRKITPILFGVSVNVDKGDFGIIRSENGENFALISQEGNTIFYKLYNQEAEEVESGNYEFDEIGENGVTGLDIKINNQGDLIMLQSALKNLTLTKIGSKEFSRDFSLELEGEDFASEVNMEIVNDDIYISGLIETNEPVGKRRVERKNIGVFNFKISQSSGELINEINLTKILPEIIEENLTKYEKKRISKGKKNAKDFLNQFSLSDVVITEDGETYLFIEYFDFYVTTSYSTNGGTTTTPHYVGGNIIAFRFNQNNELDWEKTIVKYSNNTTPHYRSFVSIYDNLKKQVHLIFNDHGGKYPGNHSTYKGLIAGNLNRVLTDYVLESNSNGERRVIVKMIEGKKKYKLKTFSFAINRSMYYDDNTQKVVIPVIGKKMGYFIVGIQE